MSERAAGAERALDVVTLGESMLRFSVRPGDLIEDAPQLDVHVAGSEANVAYALARMGVRASWLSVLPDNPLGQRVATTLRSGGVDVSAVGWTPEGRLGTYFVQLGSPPRPTTVTYDRAGTTMALARPEQFDWSIFDRAHHFHVSGITFAVSDAARQVATQAVREARARGCTVSLDVNHRARMWTAEQAASTLEQLAGAVDLVICKGQDAADLFGASGPPRSVAQALGARFQAPAVACTWGAEPATLLLGSEWLECPAQEVQMVDRIGAGDAFAAGLLWGLVEDALPTGLRRGVAMAALSMTVHGDLLRLPREAVEALLSSTGRDVDR
ncbi:MAG: sugar kinase [Candidatus Dormiibacterota bacterium]